MSSDYLLKKYGVAPKVAVRPGEEVKEKKKKKKKETPAAAAAGGLKIVDQDEEGWKTVGAASEAPQHSDIYKQMLKDYQKNHEEMPDEDELDELEGAQIVQTNFRVREGSNWETIDLNEIKAQVKKEARGGESPPRRTRHDSPEGSPPRRPRHDSPDASPPRRTRHDSPDASPPRRIRNASPDASPPRRTRHDSPDASPPRRRREADSPVRKPEAQKDFSPPRRNAGNEDLSPPRKKARADDDLSPPRKDSPEATFETIYRDKKSGRRVDVKVEKLKAAEKKKQEEEEAAKHMVWGKGLVQKKESEERLRNIKEIAAQPFAVYKKDLKNDNTLRGRERWGDPMAGLVSSKKDADVSSRPKYKGPQPPPNRFDIPPGYRWDGVDRSNGFERQLLLREANKEAMREEAYQYSVSDM